MEEVKLEQWEVDLWDLFEDTLRRAGGGPVLASALGGLLTTKGYAAKVKAKWGSFGEFLDSCNRQRFVVSGKSGKERKVALFSGVKGKVAKSDVGASSVPSNGTKAGPIGEREEGVVMKLNGRKMYIRANFQQPDCPERELYFASFTHLRDKNDAALIRANTVVSFIKSSLDPNPNPYASDVVVINVVHSGNDNNVKVAAQTRPLFKVIEDEESCRLACVALSESTCVALDCEGVNLGRAGGRLCLVQVASRSAGVFLFDVVKCPNLFDAGLKELCQNSRIVKVVHDCKMDVVALHEHGVNITPVYDSQVAYSIIEDSTRNFSLADVVLKITGKHHPQKASAPHLFDEKFWEQRELSGDALAYAASDVELLLEVAESERFTKMSSKNVMNVFWKTRARIADAIKEAVHADLSASTPVNVYELYARTSENSVSSSKVELVEDAEYDKLLDCLPLHIVRVLEQGIVNAKEQLMDVVMDLERPICFVLRDDPIFREEACIVTEDDLSFVQTKFGGEITDSNRACIGSSLHRCSVIRDPNTEKIIGLTLRMARSIRGLADMIKDVIGDGKSLLLVGPPGLGKTTLLRDIAFALASDAHRRRVMVVDTNNEIAGEHTLPHRAIGNARRMKVGARAQQYRRMLEAVQNHTPQTLIIDEIGTKQEVTEAVGVKQRGVQLIATTHGRTLSDVIRNPHLRDLLGGVNTVILSAQERLNERATSKTRNERRMEPAFDVCLELIGVNKWRLHHDVAASVDVVLRQVLSLFCCVFVFECCFQ
jgi:stage III sporulation protein SpoIIIAA